MSAWETIDTRDNVAIWRGRDAEGRRCYAVTAHRLRMLVQPTQADTYSLREARKLAREHKSEYGYRTDGGEGAIFAADFGEAVRRFEAMFTPALIADGAWGFITDTDGTRHYVCRENMP